MVLKSFASFAEWMAVGEERPPRWIFIPVVTCFGQSARNEAATLRENHQVQVACGADVVLWNRAELAAAFPHLRVDDLELASYGRSDEGWFNNTGLMNGFRARARALGCEFVSDEVVAIGHGSHQLHEVQLQSGPRIRTGTLVNAAGPRAALTARMAGLAIPVEPRKRTVFVLDCAENPEGSAAVNHGRLPLMIDPSGVFCRPEGRYFMAGCVPADDAAVDWDDFEPRYHEFEEIIWPVLAQRSAAFEALKVVNQWAGHYAFNTLDHNMIIGRHPDMHNFIFANGFSGHGLQQSPAVGRGVAELIAYGEFRSLDLSVLGVERIIEQRPFLEKAVI
ncbi:MAG: FAD-binding oxidoreductase [Thiolinea sp.]